MITDHHPVSFTIILPEKNESIKNNPIREYINLKKLKNLLRDETWSDMIFDGDVNNSMKYFIRIFTHFIEERNTS